MKITNANAVGAPIGALPLLESGIFTTYWPLTSRLNKMLKPLRAIRNEYTDALKAIEGKCAENKELDREELQKELNDRFWDAESEMEIEPLKMSEIDAAQASNCRLEISSIALPRLIELGFIID
jgi:hypothetical protein